MKNTTKVWLGTLLALVALAPRAQAQEGASLIVAQDGEVQATFLGHSASYTNDLYLDDPLNSLGIIFTNQTSPVGTTVSLGHFTAGQELVFRLHVRNTQQNFFTGPASRNPDNHAHALITENWQPGLTRVDFEDLLNGPFNYNDLSFAFSNTAASTIPEPGTMALLGAGLLPLLRMRKRSK